MPTKILPPGSYVLDAASFVSLQAVRSAVAHPNCDALELYNGGLYGCTIEHVKIVVDSGKGMGPNWERRANEAMFGAGAWAVDSARAGVEKWGIDPSSVPTVLSGVDFSTLTSQFGQLDYWHETACDRADETDTWIGYYGETKYGNHLIQQPWWTRARRKRPTWTWGGSGMITGTNMKQHVGFPSGIDWSSVGVTVDESRVEAGIEMVFLGESPPPPPPPPPDLLGGDMPAYVYTPPIVSEGVTLVNGVYEIVAGTRRHVTSDEWYEVVKGVHQNEDGSWPAGADPAKGEVPPGRPVAWLCNGWALNGVPVYEPSPGGSVLVAHHHDNGATGPAVAG